VAVANALRVPLFYYINQLYNQYQKTTIVKIPTPLFNIINGGKHGSSNLDFQEFHIIPASNIAFSQGLHIAYEVYTTLKDILNKEELGSAVGDEGGFSPSVIHNTDALNFIRESILKTQYRFSIDVFLGVDIAPQPFYKNNGYQLKDKLQDGNEQILRLSNNDYIGYLKSLHETYTLLYIEDPFIEDDSSPWIELVKLLGNELYVVGDDFITTNKKRLEKAIKEKSCNGVIIKPNQIGTLSEVLEVVDLAKKAGIKTIVSHRSGETNDSFIADLAIGIQSDYVKFGAPARGERVSKYNRLLAIESQLKRHKKS